MLRIRDNIRHRNDIQHAYINAINAAQDEILIANAYFLPGIRFGRALRNAAQRGVRVTITMIVRAIAMGQVHHIF